MFELTSFVLKGFVYYSWINQFLIQIHFLTSCLLVRLSTEQICRVNSIYTWLWHVAKIYVWWVSAHATHTKHQNTALLKNYDSANHCLHSKWKRASSIHHTYISATCRAVCRVDQHVECWHRNCNKNSVENFTYDQSSILHNVFADFFARLISYQK